MSDVFLDNQTPEKKWSWDVYTWSYQDTRAGSFFVLGQCLNESWQHATRDSAWSETSHITCVPEEVAIHTNRATPGKFLGTNMEERLESWKADMNNVLFPTFYAEAPVSKYTVESCLVLPMHTFCLTL